MAKHEILKLDLPGGAIPGGKDGEQLTKYQVEERREHGRDSVTRGWLGASSACESGPEGRDRVFVPEGPGGPSFRKGPLASKAFLIVYMVTRPQIPEGHSYIQTTFDKE